MKHSKRKKPWNRGKSVGQKKPFSPDQVKSLKIMMSNQGNLRDLALLSVGIDTMLRSCDLLRLKVEDVSSNDGLIKEEFQVMQQKTGKGTLVALSHKTQKTLGDWIQVSNKHEGDFLFTGLRKNKHSSIGREHLMKLVKKWAEYLKLDPKEYSTHSLRRTKASLIYKYTGNIEAVRQLLGQKSVTATSAYLNVSKREALELAKEIKI